MAALETAAAGLPLPLMCSFSSPIYVCVRFTWCSSTMCKFNIVLSICLCTTLFIYVHILQLHWRRSLTVFRYTVQPCIGIMTKLNWIEFWYFWIIQQLRCKMVYCRETDCGFYTVVVMMGTRSLSYLQHKYSHIIHSPNPPVNSHKSSELWCTGLMMGRWILGMVTV